MNRLACLLVLWVTLGMVCSASAEDHSLEANTTKEDLRQLKEEVEKIKQEYEQKIKELRQKIEDLSERQSQAAVPQQPSGASAVSSSVSGIQSFNPEISMIGDFVGKTTSDENDDNGDRFSVREVETAFSASVDPYARADFFLSLEEDQGERDFNLEEGYLTFLSLPLGLQAKLGKFKDHFGKANLYHTHNSPWVDDPTMIANFFGEEGLNGQGISLNRLISNPWDQYVELTLEAVNNDNPESFSGNNGDSLAFIAHLKNFLEFSDASNLEVGLSAATGPNDQGHGGYRTNLEGMDLTYRWRPPEQGLYKSLIFQNELLFSQKDQPLGGEVRSLGGYSYLGYQFQRRWSAGTRYDYSEFPDNNDHLEKVLSGILTFQQSEFAFLRLQYTHRERNFSDNANELWLQCNFGIGPHRAHQY